jgi:hypothetical protein
MRCQFPKADGNLDFRECMIWILDMPIREFLQGDAIFCIREKNGIMGGMYSNF